MDGQQPYDPPPQQPYDPPPQQPYYAQPPVATAASGLSDSAAGAIAYLTFIPALIFLLIEPYNQRPFVKFHAWQCIGLTVIDIAVQFLHVIPILGTIVALLVGLAVFVLWLICIINAAQGKIFKVPILGDFAAKQAGL